MTRHFLFPLLVSLSLSSLLACGSSPVEPTTPEVDGGAQVDAGTGGDTDAGNGTGEDAGSDAGMNQEMDAGFDAGTTLPPLSFETAQSAVQVIGQADFFTSTYHPTSATTLASAYGRAGVLDGRLYLASYLDNRVMGFESVPTGNNPSADFVLGQQDFTSDDPGSGAAQVRGPAGVAVEGDRLLVLDFENTRILIWNAAPNANAAPADLVVGQPGFGLGDRNCSAAALSFPEDFTVAGGKLIVSDSGNSRILVWNSVPTTSGVAADLVLGQADFTSCAADRGASPAANTLDFPTGVWSDGTRLMVADYNNHRLLVWNQFPTSNGQAADAVIGQADFTSSTGGTSASQFNYPYFLERRGDQLFVADNGNNRVLIWNTFPNGLAPADAVLGQQDFTHGAKNDQDGDGVTDGPTAQTLDSPQGLTLIDGRLLVIDGKNHRALFYEPL